MTDLTIAIDALEREMETLANNYAVSDLSTEDPQQVSRMKQIAGLKAALGVLQGGPVELKDGETLLLLEGDHPMVVAFNRFVASRDTRGANADWLWAAFSAGYEAAPQPPQFQPIDRNYQAIAILAHEAVRASQLSTGTELHPWDEESEDIRRHLLQATLAIAQGAVPPLPSGYDQDIFPGVVRTALDMYDKHGGLAIEHLIDLGEFMINTMGYEPGEGETSIVESVKLFLVQQQDELEQLRAGRVVGAAATGIEERVARLEQRVDALEQLPVESGAVTVTGSFGSVYATPTSDTEFAVSTEAIVLDNSGSIVVESVS